MISNKMVFKSFTNNVHSSQEHSFAIPPCHSLLNLLQIHLNISYFSLLTEDAAIIGYCTEVLIVNGHVVIHCGLMLLQKTLQFL